MSTALAFQFNNACGSADLPGGRVLAAEDWLRVVVFTSLFSDARVAPEMAPNPGERGGYWGDSFHSRSLGSQLWTLRRKKLTPDVLLTARDICLRALAWLIDEQHLRAVDVQIERLAANRLGIVVRATRRDNSIEHINTEFVTDGV